MLMGILAGCFSLTHQAQIVNGSFETGNFAGWTSSSGSLAIVISSVPGLGSSPGWSATDGLYFAYLRSGAGAGVYTLVSQEFAGDAGSRLEMDVFFDAGDGLPYNDDGFVQLVNTATSDSVTLYSQSVATVGNYRHDGWRTISYQIPDTGTYRLVAGVRNMPDNFFPSAIGLDRVTLQTPPMGGGLELDVETWLTDADGNPLPLDADGNEVVDVITRTDRIGNVLIVGSTPGQLMAWVSISPTAGVVNSLEVQNLVPEGWDVHPTWIPAEGGIHVYYFDGENLTEITDPNDIAATPGPVSTVELSLASFPELIGKELAPGESILLGIKLQLRRELAGTYPRSNSNAASVRAYAEENFEGASEEAVADALIIEQLKR